MFGRSRIGGGIAYFVAFFLLLPLIAVVPISFTPKRYLSMPTDEWSFRHYEALFTSDVWLASIGNSIVIAFFTSILATILGTVFGLGLWYRRPPNAALLIGLTILPLAVPPVISAIIIYFLLAKLGLLDTMSGLIVGHTIMVVPFAVVSILTALSKLDRDMELAARNLGASIWQTTFFVILPNMKFGLLSAWFLTLVLSWEETAVTLFVSGVDVITLPKRIWDNLRLNVDPIIAAVAVVMVLVTAAIIIGRALSKAELESTEGH